MAFCAVINQAGHTVGVFTQFLREKTQHEYVQII